MNEHSFRDEIVNERHTAEYKYIGRNQQKSLPEQRYFMPIYLGICQVVFIILYALFATYDTFTDTSGKQLFFLSVHVMVFVGFGFSMAYLKRFGYTSIGFSFLVAAYVFEFALLIKGLFAQTLTAPNTDWSLKLSLNNFLEADFCVMAVLITFAVLVDKLSSAQLMLLATIEVILQSFNEYICTNYLMAHDVGRSILTHGFGAYFGLSVSLVLHLKATEAEHDSYLSNILAMIGTSFLWIYWPSFNAAYATAEYQSIAVINTVLALTTSCIAAFILSSLLNKGKLNILHIRNATLAGGIGVGCIADLPMQPVGALVVGFFCGAASTLSYEYMMPCLKQFHINDTFGVGSLFGVSSLVSGLLSALAPLVFNQDNMGTYRIYKFYPAQIPELNSTAYYNQSLSATEYSGGGSGRSELGQAGFQLITLGHTLGIALIFGLITGLLIKVLGPAEMPGGDDLAWMCPEDFSLQLAQVKIRSVEDQELVEKRTTEFHQR